MKIEKAHAESVEAVFLSAVDLNLLAAVVEHVDGSPSQRFPMPSDQQVNSVRRVHVAFLNIFINNKYMTVFF